MDYGGHFRFRRHNRALQPPSPRAMAQARVAPGIQILGRRTAARRVPARFLFNYFFGIIIFVINFPFILDGRDKKKKIICDATRWSE